MSQEITIHSIIPDAEALLAMEPEELAGALLEVVISIDSRLLGGINVYNLFPSWMVNDYPLQHQEKVLEALLEAWIWLEHEGLVAPKPSPLGNAYFVTRRGHQVKNRAGLDSFRRSNLLPKQLLHPNIAQKVWSLFLRAEYDTAVFQAFKEVEVAVREAGHFEPEDIGTELMHKAFKAEAGSLADKGLPRAEQLALQLLFAGAVGLYKNPHSHRNVSISDPTQAVEMIILASHLLRIVESRTQIP